MSNDHLFSQIFDKTLLKNSKNKLWSEIYQNSFDYESLVCRFFFST